MFLRCYKYHMILVVAWLETNSANWASHEGVGQGIRGELDNVQGLLRLILTRWKMTGM